MTQQELVDCARDMLIRSNNVKDTLESVLDRTCISELLEMLSEICHDKAEHERFAYQDEYSAMWLEKDARKLQNINAKNTFAN